MPNKSRFKTMGALAILGASCIMIVVPSAMCRITSIPLGIRVAWRMENPGYGHVWIYPGKIVLSTDLRILPKRKRMRIMYEATKSVARQSRQQQ